MEMSFKVPVFFRNKFSESKELEQKQQSVQKYKNWYNHEVTQELIKSLQAELDQISEENDNKWDFVSWFQKKEYKTNDRDWETSWLYQFLNF